MDGSVGGDDGECSLCRSPRSPDDLAREECEKAMRLPKAVSTTTKAASPKATSSSESGACISSESSDSEGLYREGAIPKTSIPKAVVLKVALIPVAASSNATRLTPVCTQMPTRPYTVVVRRADEVLYAAAGVAPLVCIRFSADNFLLFFAVVAQVLPAPSDPRPRGSVAAYMVCVGFADLYFCFFVWMVQVYCYSSGHARGCRPHER